MNDARSIEYRSCRESDIPAVLELWSDSTVGGSTNTTEALLTRLARDADLFILAFDGPRIIATLMGGWDGWRATMARLAVRPEYRRNGIARTLVGMVEERLILKGARRIYAASLIESDQAGRFWRSVGYTENSVVDPLAKTLR